MSSKASAGPSNMMIVGFAVVLFGAILLGVGIHHLIRTGSCSSDGYGDHGEPLPVCPAGTGWWMLFLFGGILLGLIGSGMCTSVAFPMIFFSIFGGIGFGALSLLADSRASTGSQTFGAIFGGCFALVGTFAGFAAIPGLLKGPDRSSGPSGSGSRSSSSSRLSVARSSASRSAAVTRATGRAGTEGAPANVHFASNAFVHPTDAPKPGDDPLDQVQKLAELHASGALTDEEFAREKARVLGTG